ncbi:2,4-dienoyl-CoA reductase [Thermoactinomyces daqus]|uniref:2,4-dienoyl-CoA reductase n=1 Tax=Thermoactinomyces daqus TaxID=1329516 RepID=A0A7W1X749_9BACL|nr:2,4-dienoyl-CoA reductase [Thermoactinomyces daqus]MBA4541316.1 2,4-dienoyl-CoA reductase [Thermoactinomyces daqus]
MSLQGQTVIVTGGSSGIGKAIARRLCQEGANVVITGRNADRLEAAKAELEELPGKIFPFQMDVREVDQVKAMVQKTVEQFGGIDHLVNNAAGNFVVPAEDLTYNGWHSVINIVLNGTWYCSQAVAKEWIEKKRKGSILNIVATYAWTGAPGVVHSAAAKAGVLAMSRTLAVEWGDKYGIRVNCIAPGPIEETGGAAKLVANEKMAKKVANMVPLKRYGRPEEIAALAKFLLSAEAEYVNGECVTMDGGLWMANFRFL